jgi:hypothetical protein
LPRENRIGDFVYVLQGGRTAYVLRDLGNNYDEYVGEAYIRGTQRGEVAGKSKLEDLKTVRLK